MRSARVMTTLCARRTRLTSQARTGLLLGAVWSSLALSVTPAAGQTSTGQLTSRDELSAEIRRAEQSGNGMQAAAIRARLNDGDFHPGDKIILTYYSDATHTDTLIVRAGSVVELPGKVVLPLQGVLRSELNDRLTAELLKYVKAENVNATPLTRIGVLGEVSRPGYFAVRSDIPITDAMMLAGGPTATADVARSVVKRGSVEYRSADATRRAIAAGITLDQFGIEAGDEIVVGKNDDSTARFVRVTLGIAASIAAIYMAFHDQ